MRKLVKNVGQKIVVTFAVILIAVATLLTMPKSANAEYDHTVIMQKAMLAGLNTCISSSYLNQEAYLGAHDLGNTTNFANVIFTKRGKDTDGTVKLPTKIGNSLKDSDSTCSELLLGYNGIGKNDLAGFAVPNNLTAAAKWMEALGYEKTASASDSDSDGMQCAYVQYSLPVGSSTTTQKTNELCFGVDADGKVKNENNQAVVSSSPESTATADNILTFQQFGPTNMVEITTGITAPQSSIFYPSGLGSPLYGHTPSEMKTFLESGNYWAGVVYEGLCTSGSSRYCRERADISNMTLVIRNANQEETVDNSNYYKLSLSGRADQVKASAIEFFSNGKYNSSTAQFNNSDRYADYTYTLFNLFGIKTNSAAGCGASKSDLQDSNLAVKLLSSDGSAIYAQLDESSLNDAKNKELVKGQKGAAYVIDTRSSQITSSPVDVAGIIGYLENLNTTAINSGGLTAVNAETCIVDGVTDAPTTYNPGGGGQPGSDDTGGGDDGVYPCLEAAESLGWVLCPVLDFLGRTINVVYEKVEDSFLIVDVGMLNNDTHDAWKTFRDFANIIFIIVFLVVILSQITGFGVSNYGVKKILPRLIALAVLVNASFIICQLAVEVSNIVGANIKDLLGGLGSVKPDGEMSAGGIATEILSVLGLGAGVVATIHVAPAIASAVGAALSGTTASLWLLLILVSFFGFLVGIVFAGILLAARQAGVIILVVLSPIAIVCYALPNTKSVFDKWRKAFVSLLLVYPMCGAIVGGGQFATSLLINNNGGFFYTLVAMLLSIVPFFFIPSMVQSSMSSLGNIGAKISGAGQRFSRWAQGMARGSNLYRDAQRQRDMAGAAYTVNRLNALEARRGRLSERQARRRSRALSRGIALMEEDMRAGADTRAFPSTRTAEGRAAIDTMRAKIFEDAMNDRVAEEEAAYRNSDTFDVNSISDLETEHARLIDALDANPDDARAQAQMRAIQNLLMSQGDPGQEAIFQNYMRRAARGGDSSGLHAAARHIASDGKYMQKIKAEDKGLFSAVNHFKTGDFSHAGGGALAYYGAQGAGSYTAQTLANADLGAIERLTASIQSGAISGSDLSKLTNLANEALSNPNLQLKGDVRQRLENLVAASYGVGGSITGTSSAGSTALSGASLETLDSMVQRIRAINGGTAFTGAPTTPGAALDEYNEVQAMARNAERALRNPNTPHDAATVDRLQDILMAAQDMGVKDTSGADFNRVDPAAIKIRGIEKRTAPPTPSGWAPTGVWIGGGSGPTQQQQIAYQEWAKKAAEVDMWNKDHGF